jgi:outer membrane protein
MKSRIAACCLLACVMPAVAAGQQAAAPSTERLSLEAAIRLAVDNNRRVQNAQIQVEKAEEDVAVARTRRLPTFETEATASQLLTPVGFSFPRGAFGDFPGTGPIPSTDTTLNVPRQPVFYMSAQMSQPLTQLLRIGLSIRSAAATRDIERERARAQQLSTINEVKRLYFGILQTESALAATNEAIALYRELDRTLQARVVQKVALRSDALDVQFRLAQEELSRTKEQNSLASQKEQFNRLLGRDMRTAFDVEGASGLSGLEIDVTAAQTNALASRPDVREARLTLQQAELDRRITHAERIPDVSLAVSYSSNYNIDVLPKNLATLGVQVKWEPFDWGRRGRQLAAKDHAVRQARLSVRDTEDQAVLEVNARFRALTEAKALLNVSQMARNAAREKLRVKTNHYQLQAALLTDVLQLRAELANEDDRYQQAVLGFWTAKADYDLAMGEEVLQ